MLTEKKYESYTSNKIIYTHACKHILINFLIRTRFMLKNKNCITKFY